MATSETESQHCYSARLLKPFGRLLRQHGGLPPEVAEPVEALDPDERIPIAASHELLAAAVELTGDEDVGLRAAALIQAGDFSALEYAASTAQTGRDAVETVARYMHLINDALTVELAFEGERAVFTLESAVVLPRAAEAYQVAAFLSAFNNRAPDLVSRVPYEVMFVHEAPADTSAYAERFGPNATIHFGAAFCGWSCPASVLEQELDAADPHLHELVTRHADMLLADLPRAGSVTARVRELITAGLAGGKASIAAVARELHISQRTLARRLDDEGTSFKALTEEIRRRFAQRYVAQTDLAFSEIAFLLGFSQVSAFHRAFKRWTDRTPLEYRSAHRG